MGGSRIQMPSVEKIIQARHLHRLHKVDCSVLCKPILWLLMYKFDVFTITQVVVCEALQKYEIKFIGKRVCEKLILCLN